MKLLEERLKMSIKKLDLLWAKVMQKFDAKCYDLLVKIPIWKVTSYKEIAEALGTKAYRAVWGAMNRNPNAPSVPCHRVVSTNWWLGGYAFGLENKISILENEWIVVEIRNWKYYVKDFKDILFKF